MFVVIILFHYFAPTNAITCPSGWTPGTDFCYQMESSPATGTFDQLFAECSMLGFTLPVFYTSADYSAFKTIASSNQVAIGYMRNGYNSNPAVDGQVSFLSIYGGPMTVFDWNTGEPNNFNNTENCVMTAWVGSSWNDISCAYDKFAPFCQSGPAFDPASVSMQCSKVCRGKSQVGVNHRFTTNTMICNQDGFSIDEPQIGFAIPFAIPGGFTQIVSEMISPTNQIILSYGLPEQKSWLSKSYKIRSIFFVMTQPIVANDVRQFVLMMDSLTNPTDSVITPYLSSEYVSLNNSGWKVAQTFYMFTKATSGVCSLAKDCEWNDWGSWSSCTLSCGTGTQTAQRTKNLGEHNNGICDNIYSTAQECNTQPCPIDCEWSAWNDWTSCSLTCSGGIRNRTRTKIVEDQFLGFCNNIYDDYDNCSIGPCPIDCIVTNWTLQDACSVTCGEGVEQWQRSVLVTAKFGGESCPADYTETRNCTLDPCPIYSQPFNLQGYNCIPLVLFTAFTFGLFLCLRVFSFERTIHMCQEISLFCAHFFIAIFALRSRTDNINTHLCAPISIATQYFYIAYFTFLALESLQMYCILTNVLSDGGFFKMRYYMLIGWGFPALITGPVAAFYYSHYPSVTSCYTNWGHSFVSSSSLIPVLFLSQLCIIFNEASGMDMGHLLPLLDRDKFSSAIATRVSILILIPLNVVTWMVGSLAVYKNTLFAHATVTAFNAMLGVAIFPAHVSANEQVHDYVRHHILCCCHKKKTSTITKK